MSNTKSNGNGNYPPMVVQPHEKKGVISNTGVGGPNPSPVSAAAAAAAAATPANGSTSSLYEEDRLSLLEAKMDQNVSHLQAKVDELQSLLAFQKADTSNDGTDREDEYRRPSPGMEIPPDEEETTDEENPVPLEEQERKQKQKRSLKKHLSKSSSQAANLARAAPKKLWVGHQKGVVMQVKTMDLLEKFNHPTAYMIALVLLLIKIAFVAIFVTWQQSKCTPSTALLNADKDPDLFESIYSPKKHQYICATSSLDSHKYAKKSQEWLQLFDGINFGRGNTDPKEYMDLSREGYPYLWTGADAMLASIPTGSTQSNGTTSTKSDDEDGWVLYSGLAFAHTCAAKCAEQGADIGFWALDYITVIDQCWCNLHRLSTGYTEKDRHTLSPVCQVTYNTDYNDYPASFASESDLSQDMLDSFTHGFDETELADFHDHFDATRTGNPRRGCRYDQKADFTDDQAFKPAFYAWKDSLFGHFPIIVFSREPAVRIPRCNVTSDSETETTSYLDQLCNLDLSGIVLATIVGSRSSVLANSSKTKEDRDAQRAWNPFVEYVEDFDHDLSTEYWHHCSLQGFSCSDYQHDQCEEYRASGETYCGEQRFFDDDTVQHDGFERQCYGITSITWITCKSVALTLGSSLAYLVFIEIIMVGLISAGIMLSTGRTGEAFGVLTGALKSPTRHTVTRIVNAQLKEVKEQLAEIRPQAQNKGDVKKEDVKDTKLLTQDAKKTKSFTRIEAQQPQNTEEEKRAAEERVEVVMTSFHNKADTSHNT